jgi:hypothetical protein
MRFLLQTVGSLLLVAALWIGANLFRLGEPVEGEMKYWCGMVDLKRQIAQEVASPKLVVIGASNVLYGVRAEQISAQTNIPAVNFGMVSSLGVDIITAAARSVLQPGDVVILALEHPFFEDRDYNGPFVQQGLLSCKTDALFTLPLKEQLRMILLQPPVEVLQASAQRAWKLLTQPAATASTYHPDRSSGFDAAGDFLNNESSKVTVEMRHWVADHPGGLSIEFSRRSAGARAVQNLITWARQNGVTVLANWPTVYWPRRDLAEPGLRQIEAFYKSLGIPVLGNPEDTMLPLENFFDTNNHLTAEAARERTARLIVLLRPYLPRLYGTRPQGEKTGSDLLGDDSHATDKLATTNDEAPPGLRNLSG